MRISRLRIAVSATIGLTLALVALAVATLLDQRSDPELARSRSLRTSFRTPSAPIAGTGQLRTPRIATPAPQLAADPTPAAPQPAAAAQAISAPPTIEHDDERGDDDPEQAEVGEQEEGD